MALGTTVPCATKWSAPNVQGSGVTRREGSGWTGHALLECIHCPLDGAWASLALGERGAMSLCERHFTSLG